MSLSSQVFTNVHTLPQRPVWCCWGFVAGGYEFRLSWLSQVNTAALRCYWGVLLLVFGVVGYFQLGIKPWAVRLTVSSIGLEAVVMEATIEEVIKDINMSLPERKLKQLIERTNLSADVKGIMSDIVHVTIKVGGKVLAIGRKILTFVLDLVKTFPAIAMGTIAALVITAVVGAVPLIGAPLAAFVGPILLAIGVTAGALKDFTSDKLQDRITALIESFKVLVEL